MIDEKGQVALDFLLGISLFLIALMFIVQFIPGLFISSSANEGSLDHTAYRTATILAEDSGWWSDSITSSTDWEDHTDKVKRIGLAVDDDSSSKLTNSPNLISKNKTLAMMLINETVFVEKLGLYDNVNDALFTYGYNISFTQDGVPLVIDDTAITRGNIIPTDRDVTKIVRIVLIETGNAAYFDAEELTTNNPVPSENVYMNIAGPLSENITILISNFNTTSNPAFENMTLDGAAISPLNYSVYKKTDGTYLPYSGQLVKDDMLRLDLNSDLFNSNQTYLLKLAFNDILFTTIGPPLECTTRNEAFYEPAYLNVVVWQ